MRPVSVSSFAILMLVLANSHAGAQMYPEELRGVWGGRAESQGDDREIVARKACASYWKNKKAVVGDVLVFEGASKSSFGGYADYIDKNISVESVGPNRWRIKDQHFQDEEGGNVAGDRTAQYEAIIDGNTLTIKERDYTSRFERCIPPIRATAPPKIASADGECEVRLDAVDLQCTRGPVYTALQNGNKIVSFPNSQIAVVSFTGSKTSQNGSNRVLWVDRVYLNQNMQLADGQCSLSLSEQPQRLECKAVLRDGRKLGAALKVTKVDDGFLVGVPAAQSMSKAECKKIIETHGFLSRAQFQCKFSRYSNQMLQATKGCSQTMNERDARAGIEAGMRTFDRNEKMRGRTALCSEVLRAFPNLVAR